MTMLRTVINRRWIDRGDDWNFVNNRVTLGHITNANTFNKNGDSEMIKSDILPEEQMAGY